MTIIDSLIETQEFATLPTVAMKVLQLLENDDVSISEISKIIEADPSLTLKLLRVANSPIYGIKQHISSIHQAIITLGLNRLTNIVIGVSIFSRLLIKGKGKASEFMDRFWWHSSCTAITAKAISSRINKNFKEIEFLGGLIHDIGKIAMLQYDAEKYFKADTMVTEKGMLDIEAERIVFGVDHLEVGEAIAKLWKLPDDLVEVIGKHNTPENANSDPLVVSVVRFADILCELWGAGINEGIGSISFPETSCWQIITKEYPELNDLDFEKFTFELEAEYKKSSEFLSIIAS